MCSCLGRYPSRARIEPRTGKPLKAVLAARTRIRAVTTDTNTNIGVKFEKTAWATWAITVFCSVPGGMPIRSSVVSATFTLVTTANHVMPPNIVMAIAPSIARVVAAFLLFGLRNAGTPLLIASMPVRAVVPDEKARAIRNTRAAPAKFASGLITQSADSASRTSPRLIRTPAQMSIVKMAKMKAYVGMAKALPDSRTPRRLMRASSAVRPMARATLCWPIQGIAEAALATAEEIDTATVST